MENSLPDCTEGEYPIIYMNQWMCQSPTTQEIHSPMVRQNMDGIFLILNITILFFIFLTMILTAKTFVEIKMESKK